MTLHTSKHYEPHMQMWLRAFQSSQGSPHRNVHTLTPSCYVPGFVVFSYQSIYENNSIFFSSVLIINSCSIKLENSLKSLDSKTINHIKYNSTSYQSRLCGYIMVIFGFYHFPSRLKLGQLGLSGIFTGLSGLSQ